MDIDPIPMKDAWELEYQSPQLLTKDQEPTKAFRSFVSWLTKEQGIDLSVARVLDIGCGTGRNLLYLSEHYGTEGVGLDISDTALSLAKERAPQITWLQHDLEQGLPSFDQSFDIVIDSTTSHLVSETARESLVRDVLEVLGPGGFLYVRTLTKDGDRNAHNLMKHMPGPEFDSYIHPKLGVVEHVWSSERIRDLYEDFEVVYEKKYTGYQKWGAQSYKRRYLNLYLQKHE